MKRILLFSCLLLGITSVNATELSKTDKYAATANIWGFLKYYHPQVNKGKFNWDEELVAILNRVDSVQNKDAFSKVMLSWIDDLGKVRKVKHKEIHEDYLFTKNKHLSWLQNTTVLSDELVKKIRFIEKNRHKGKKYYMEYTQPHIFKPKNAVDYQNFEYPTEKYRLLTLFTYWNIVEYYYPYKYLCEPWDDVLTEMIPKFIGAQDTVAYHLAIKELVAKTNDSHSEVSTKYTYKHFGKYWMPIKFKIIDQQLVVSGFYNDSLARLDDLQIGDIVLEIDGKKAMDIVNENKKYAAASNKAVLYRKMFRMILNGSEESAEVVFVRNGQKLKKKVNRYTYANLKYDRNGPYIETVKILEGNIGYVNMGLLMPDEVKQVLDTLKSCKAIIFDIRNYPKGTMYKLAPYLIPERQAFAKFTHLVYSYPGKFYFTRTYYCGGDGINRKPSKKDSTKIETTKSKKFYAGKVVLLVNETTQSHAEFTCMCLQQGDNVTVMGSQTSGADGNVTVFELPGGYRTAITGLGVYYPDGGETQGVGVRIDIQAKPTIEGIQDGRDEVLEKAIDFINEGD